MQNKEPNKFTRLWKEKGYYILLALCVAAVGVSGYFFITGAMEEKQSLQESLSVPVTVEKPKTENKTGKPASTQTGQTETAAPQAESEPASAQAAVSDPVEDQPLTVLPVNGAVTQDYAMDHLTYHATTQDWRVHNGVDLAADLGAGVKAAKAGTVSAVYEDDYYGTTVVIQHDGGYTSHYCNLADQALVAVGDTVRAGDTIGTVGQTALLETGEEPHLHFEVYHDGEPTNPAGFLY